MVSLFKTKIMGLAPTVSLACPKKQKFLKTLCLLKCELYDEKRGLGIRAEKPLEHNEMFFAPILLSRWKLNLWVYCVKRKTRVVLWGVVFIEFKSCPFLTVFSWKQPRDLLSWMGQILETMGRNVHIPCQCSCEAILLWKFKRNSRMYRKDRKKERKWGESRDRIDV